MSLAADILKRATADLSPPAPPKRRDVITVAKTRIKQPRKTKEKRVEVKVERERPTTPPGVSFTYYAWRLVDGSVCTRDIYRAYMRSDGKTVMLGEFPTAARASLAYKLYRHWQKHGYHDIPNKPVFRTYCKW